MREYIKVEANLMTDEFMAYAGANLFYNHQVVKHGEGEYVNGNTHTNRIENFWSQLKLGITGVYHQVSVKHFDTYGYEFEFRYNYRKIKEGERADYMLLQSDGRLMYKDLIKQ